MWVAHMVKNIYGKVDARFTYGKKHLWKGCCKIHLWWTTFVETLLRGSHRLRHKTFFEYVRSFRVERNHKRCNWLHFDLSVVHYNHKKLPHKVDIVHIAYEWVHFKAELTVSDRKKFHVVKETFLYHVMRVSQQRCHSSVFECAKFACYKTVKFFWRCEVRIL